jgi:methionyl-tRNA formyltransferase
MRIIFMGTPEFAVPCLSILVDHGYDIAAVITAPDSLGGRGGKQLLESPVKRYAVERGIPILQPTNLKSEAFLAELKTYRADIQIVVAFRMLPEVVWNMPALGTINLHGSLLPRYRGAAPIHHAVMRGETETGVTTFRLKHAIDTGDIILQRKMSIGPDENTGSVHDRMMTLGAQAILDTAVILSQGNVSYQSQADDEATHAPKLFHHNCQIDFRKTQSEVHNFIRGLSPFPGAWCVIDGKEYKIFESTKSPEPIENIASGTIVCDKKSLRVACVDGWINIQLWKPEGQRMMSIIDYLNGHKISILKAN